MPVAPLFLAVLLLWRSRQGTRRYPNIRGGVAPVVYGIADEVLEELVQLRLVPGNDGKPGDRDTGPAFVDRGPEVGGRGLDYGGAIHGRKGPRLRGHPGVRQEVFDQALALTEEAVRTGISRGAFLVALTGYGRPEDRELAREAGFDLHLTKPVDIDVLMKLLRREPGTLATIIARCCQIKADVVGQDETEGGLRAILNFGHTVGHALETASGYALLHGEAVAVGMAVEARLAVRLRLAEPGLEARQNALLERLGLPTRLPPLSRELLLEHVNRDKKVFGDAPRWILPTSEGRVTVSRTVPEEEVIAALEERS